jgi:hypothetical protein
MGRGFRIDAALFRGAAFPLGSGLMSFRFMRLLCHNLIDASKTSFLSD